MQPVTAIFYEVMPQSDGGVGTIGEEQEVYKCPGEFKPIKSTRTQEAAQTSLKNAGVLEMWATKNYTPKVGSTVEVQGRRLTIQGMQYTDVTQRKHQLTLVSQSGQVSN